MNLTSSQWDALLNGFYENHIFKKWLFNTNEDQKLLKEHIEYYVDIYDISKLISEMNSGKNLEDIVTHFYFTLEDVFMEDFYENDFFWIDKLTKHFSEEWKDAGYDVEEFISSINIQVYSSWNEIEKAKNPKHFVIS